MSPRLRIPGAWAVALIVLALNPPTRADDGWIELLPGNLDAWKTPHGAWEFVESVALKPDNSRMLVAKPGQSDPPILYNGPSGRTGNLVSRESFGDCEVHLEFNVPQGSNSGIKLHGHYEIQIADSWGKGLATKATVGPHYYPVGGIYPRGELRPRYHHLDKGYLPRVNSSKPPGEWQSLDIVFRAPRFDANNVKTDNACFVKVVLNGEVLHENQELPCPTGHAWVRPEMTEGPILLQGDHGPVAFRNLKVRPLPAESTAEQP